MSSEAKTCALCGRALRSVGMISVVTVRGKKYELCSDGLGCRRTVLSQRMDEQT